MTGVVEYTRVHHELSYTFGGRRPVMRAPASTIRVYTHDCFGGAVRHVDDLPSQVCQLPKLNPVFGPFHVIGAEPGDTLVIHLVRILDRSPVPAVLVRAFATCFGAWL